MSKRPTCMECGAEMASQVGDYRYEESGLPNVTLHGVTVRTCPACGETEVSVPRVEALHRKIALALARQPSELLPEEIRFLRKHLGYSSTDFARRMGVTKETVSRWENRDKPLRMKGSADRLLRLMAETEDPLRSYPVTHRAEIHRLDVTLKDSEWEAGPIAAAG